MMIDQSKEKKQKGTEEIKEIKGRKQNGVLMHTWKSKCRTKKKEKVGAKYYLGPYSLSYFMQKFHLNS